VEDVALVGLSPRLPGRLDQEEHGRRAWRGDSRDREPTEAEFEAVRREVLGLDEAWTREAGEPGADAAPA
jgi:hypothetical protein